MIEFSREGALELCDGYLIHTQIRMCGSMCSWDKDINNVTMLLAMCSLSSWFS